MKKNLNIIAFVTLINGSIRRLLWQKIIQTKLIIQQWIILTQLKATRQIRKILQKTAAIQKILQMRNQELLTVNNFLADQWSAFFVSERACLE